MAFRFKPCAAKRPLLTAPSLGAYNEGELFPATANGVAIDSTLELPLA